MSDLQSHPMQPVYKDEGGVLRFKANPIVRYLLDAGSIKLSQIAYLPGISDEDHRQFAQLIGYSISGYGELPYVDDESYAEARRRACYAEARRRADEAVK